MIRFHLSGPHAHRTPLSYPWLRPLFASRLEPVADPSRAGLLVFAHPWDIQFLPEAVARAWRQRRQPVVLLSEEPFWDSLWSPDPLARELIFETRFGALPVTQLNHHTTAIYDFDRIPYILLTEPGFIPALASRLARNARLSAEDWRQDFARRPHAMTFMAERRPEAFHDVAFPAGDLVGLCAWRTRLAEAVPGAQRLGVGWQPGLHRLELDDWHLDKLERLDRQTRILSAVENTHQPAYLTEKFFDAFACGARPAGWFSPSHRVHRLDLPPDSWINLHGLTLAEAAGRLGSQSRGSGFFEAFRGAQNALAGLLADPAAIEAERRRLAAAVLAEVGAVFGVRAGKTS